MIKKLDRSLLEEVKRAFVSMPAGADPSMGAGPVAGGGMLTQAQASPMGGTPPMDPSMGGGAPMDPSMMGGDPNAGGGGAGMDPSMMGGAGGAPAGDPSMGGGAPMDPSMMGGDPSMGAAAAPQSQITMTVPDLISLIQALGVGGGAKPKTPKAESGAAPAGGNTSGLESKIDQLTQMLAGLGGPGAGGAPAQ